MNENAYVELRDGHYYIRGHRVPVTSLAAVWQEGASAETVHANYPSLSMAEVFEGLAFYLDHQAEVDNWLIEDAHTFEAAQAAQMAANPERYADLKRRFDAVRARNEASAS